MEVGVGEWKCNYSRPFRKNMPDKPTDQPFNRSANRPTDMI